MRKASASYWLGFAGSNLYIVLDGEAGVVIGGVERARLGRGEFFGDVSALLEVTPTAEVVAAVALRCLVIPAGELDRFLLAYPPSPCGCSR